MQAVSSDCNFPFPYFSPLPSHVDPHPSCLCLENRYHFHLKGFIGAGPGIKAETPSVHVSGFYFSQVTE